MCRTALKFQPLLETTFPNYMQEIRGELIHFYRWHVTISACWPGLAGSSVTPVPSSALYAEVFIFIFCRLLTLSQ